MPSTGHSAIANTTIGSRTKINIVTNRRDTTGSSPHEQRENCSTDRADEKLTGNCRSNAELFEMIVTSDLAHERKKRTRRNEHGKAIADDDERCRDAERSEQQHRRRHHECQPRIRRATRREIAFVLLTMLPILPRRFSATSVVASAVLSGFCCGAKRSCAEDSARYSFAAARIFRARSTTISDVTCFMQA